VKIQGSELAQGRKGCGYGMALSSSAISICVLPGLRSKDKSKTTIHQLKLTVCRKFYAMPAVLWSQPAAWPISKIADSIQFCKPILSYRRKKNGTYTVARTSLIRVYYDSDKDFYSFLGYYFLSSIVDGLHSKNW